MGLAAPDPPFSQQAPRSRERSAMELSFGEELLWKADVRDPGVLPFFDCARSLSLTLRLQGQVNHEALRSALEAIVQRHDALRSRFVVQSGQPKRVSGLDPSIKLTVIDQSSVSPENWQGLLEHIIAQRVDGSFDLARGPLLLAALAAMGRGEHILHVAVHHIAFDRWSTRLLAHELTRFYEAHVTGRATELPPLPAQYQSYVQWQRQRLESEQSRKMIEYWLKRLDGLPDIDLRSDRAGSRPLSTRPGSSWFTIPAEDVNRLMALSRHSRATLATIVLAVFNIFLCRIGGTDDIAVGVPLSDRRRPEFESLIGLFMNVVVVRTSIAHSLTFMELLDRVRRGLVDACLHQDLPYGYLLKLVGARPLYRVVFNFMPSLPALEVKLIGANATLVQTATNPESVADLSLNVRADNGALLCRLLYKADLFSEACGERFAKQLQTLISAVLHAPNNRIDQYNWA
jgi:Condensation domain